jgi:hypothetical protein
VVYADEPLVEKAELLREPAIVMDLADGVRVSISASASEPVIAAALKALRS